jgi:hypothetical protein
LLARLLPARQLRQLRLIISPRTLLRWHVADLSQERTERRPTLGGLIHECERAA